MSVPIEQEFWLRMLFDWENEQLYKCVTVLGPKDSNGKRAAFNHAVQTFDDMAKLIDARMKWPNYDVYAAMGALRMALASTSQDGFLNVERKRNNVVSFKPLFIDIDVKPNDPAAYAATAEAEAALQKFLADTGMPEPSMVVRSGSGGLHVYWVADLPMDIATWQPLADALKRACEHHGLKADPVVTADAARILRVPGTLNYKTNPPVVVALDNPGALAPVHRGAVHRRACPVHGRQGSKAAGGGGGGTTAVLVVAELHGERRREGVAQDSDRPDRTQLPDDGADPGRWGSGEE